MSKFKVGDRVRRINDGSHKGMNIGDIGVVSEVFSTFLNIEGYERDSTGQFYEDYYELVSSNNNMNLKEKFITAFLAEPEKSFRKAGITNGDGILTTEGQEVFLTWLLNKQGAEFKTEVVDELLKEEKKN